MKRILSVGALFLASACSDATGPERSDCDPALLQLQPVSGDTVTTETGLRYIEVRAGTGSTAAVGHAVRAHYSGYLVSGTRFDTSCERGAPIRYTLPGDVVAGFWQGTVGMREGGVRRLIIPPNLGYGGTAQPGIPANSTLVFEVELLGVQ